MPAVTLRNGASISAPGYRVCYGRQGSVIEYWKEYPDAKNGPMTEPYRQSLLESLKDPDEAAHYLNACLQDEDSQVFLMALRDVADAHGGIRALSEETRLNRENLYRMLLRSGNPSLENLGHVLSAFGLRLAVQSADPKRGKRRIAS